MDFPSPDKDNFVSEIEHSSTRHFTETKAVIGDRIYWPGSPSTANTTPFKSTMFVECQYMEEDDVVSTLMTTPSSNALTLSTPEQSPTALPVKLIEENKDFSNYYIDMFCTGRPLKVVGGKKSLNKPREDAFSKSLPESQYEECSDIVVVMNH